MIKLLLAFAALALTACLEGAPFDTTYDGSPVAPPCFTGHCTHTAEATQTAYEAKQFIYTISTTNTGSTYYVANKPSWMTIDTTNKELTGVPVGSGTISDLKISIYDGTDTEQIGPFDLDVIGDPLAKYAWHLSNTGQQSFSASGGTAGEDINLGPVVLDGLTGSGVRIAVSDTGVEITHEDLAGNLSAGESRDYGLASPWLGDPTPTDGEAGHGTAVTGLIAAVGWNSLGSRGVAPEAKFAGFKFIGETFSTAKWVDQASHDFDIYNYSYGYPQCSFQALTGASSYQAQLEVAVSTYRSGNGSLFVKAAGNDFIADLNDCSSLIPSGTLPFFGNANIDQNNIYPQQIIVGAVNAKGNHSSYSSPGANIWVSATGGEFGSSSPAMITTDMEGCANGLSTSTNIINAFDKGTNSLNSNCNYTSTMNGTSSATPVTSGVIALMLEANPSLTWREVKDILATTATVINPNAGSTSHPWGYNLTGHTYQQGWVTNAAGFKFHNWYGFGRVNAAAAVTAAAAYTGGSMPALVETINPDDLSYYYTKTVNTAIPDNSKTGVTSTITSVHNLVTEAVQVKVNITHNFISDLGIELTSPSGTKSILKNINDVSVDQDMDDVVLLSNAFYGESSRGDWKLKVLDGNSGTSGTFVDWSLNIFGHIDSARTDVTPTAAVTITSPADGATSATLASSPTVTWTAPADSDVMRYEYSIGTTSGGTELVPWNSVGTALTKTRSGLGLTDGTTYYFNVRVIDTSENVSPVATISWIADI